MNYDKTDYFRFINKLREAAMTAPYGAYIPRDALIEMMGVLSTHYNGKFPVPTAMNIGPALAAARDAYGVQEKRNG